jgi:hypothetical protein
MTSEITSRAITFGDCQLLKHFHGRGLGEKILICQLKGRGAAVPFDNDANAGYVKCLVDGRRSPLDLYFIRCLVDSELE